MVLPEDDKSSSDVGDGAKIEVADEPKSVDSDVPANSDALQLALETKKAVVLNGIATLLATGSVDEIDSAAIRAVIEFIENPTENLADIQIYTNRIARVCFDYEVEGKETPAEIDALHAYLLTMQCINRINFVEGEIARGAPDSTEVLQALEQAEDAALILKKGYKDETQLRAVEELSERLKSITGDNHLPGETF